MTYDFFMGQLRLIAIALIAYGAGAHWFSEVTGGLLGGILTPVGLLIGPWIWSLYRNINMKLVPKDSVAIPKSDVIFPMASGNTPEIGDSVAIKTTLQGASKIVGCLIAALMLLAFAPDARAQQRVLTGNIAKDFNLQGNDGKVDILKALDAVVLPDLKYAKLMADATNSKVTAPCYGAWIDIIETRQKALTDASGAEIPKPNPRVISDFERAVELRNALQPDSDFMLKCSPVASMVKKDILGFMGLVLGGGASLATLVPGL